MNKAKMTCKKNVKGYWNVKILSSNPCIVRILSEDKKYEVLKILFDHLKNKWNLTVLESKNE